MKSKLGFHIDIQAYAGQAQQMISAGTRVIKVITSMGLLQEMHRALGDKTTYIARDWQAGDDFLRFGGDNDPKAAAQRWFNEMLSTIKQAPFAYWESFNEMSHWEALSAYGEFEAERQRIMHDAGYKCCIGNFAVGTPEIADQHDIWPRFYPALEAAHHYKNILGLHEYGGLWMDLWYGTNTGLTKGNKRKPLPDDYAEGWLFGRYRKVWRKHLQPNGWTDIRIVLTEFGLDMAGTSETSPLTGQTVGAWKSCIGAWERLDGRRDPEQYYVEQLQWADRQLQKDPYVLGATIFTWGTFPDSLWVNHDIHGGVADRLIDYIKATKDDEMQPPSPETTLFLTPLSREPINLRQRAVLKSPVVALIQPGTKLAALETETAVKAKLGKSSQWIKVRTPDGVEGYIAGAQAQIVETAIAAEKVFVTPIQTGVILRQDANIQGLKIENLFMGDQLEMLDTRAFVVKSVGKAGSWIKVKSPRAKEGWVETALVQLIKIGEPTKPEEPAKPKPEEPTKPKEKIFVRTNADGGQFLRFGPATTFGKVASVFPTDKLEVIGVMGADGDARARLGKKGEWLQVRTPKNEIGWAGSALLELWSDQLVSPVGHALVGIHGPADPGDWPWDEEAYQIIRTGRMEAVKLLAGGDITGNIVNRLKQDGVKFIMARLFAKFPNPRTPQSFVDEVIEPARRLYNSGVRYFEVHNEPNLHTGDAPEGMWVCWQNGREFGDFFLQSMALLRKQLPEAKFGWPGVSPGDNVPNIRVASEPFLQEADSAIRKADFVCMHTYWGGDGTNYMDSINKVRAFCNRFPNQLILVTEFSNTAHHIGRDAKGREYAAFYDEAKKLPRNLGGLFSYVLSASSGFSHETWKGHPVADFVGKRNSVPV